jgi:hypothetical protein
MGTSKRDAIGLTKTWGESPFFGGPLTNAPGRFSAEYTNSNKISPQTLCKMTNKNFPKPIDKRSRMCYNITVIKGQTTAFVSSQEIEGESERVRTKILNYFCKTP